MNCTVFIWKWSTHELFSVECLMDSPLRCVRIIPRRSQIQRYYCPAEQQKIKMIQFLKSDLKKKKRQNWVISCYVLIFNRDGTSLKINTDDCEKHWWLWTVQHALNKIRQIFDLLSGTQTKCSDQDRFKFHLESLYYGKGSIFLNLFKLVYYR